MVEDFIFPIDVKYLEQRTKNKAQYLQFAKNVYTPKPGKYDYSNRQYIKNFVDVLIKQYEYNVYLFNSNYLNFTRGEGGREGKKKLKRVLIVDIDMGC